LGADGPTAAIDLPASVPETGNFPLDAPCGRFRFNQPPCGYQEMAIATIKAFSEKAKTDPELKEKLLACQKIKELRALAAEQGFEIDEVELYPPNEPQFTADQLSEKLQKALLRA
jgi:predicted ribosomally synthesized peptide with nif11-like leader